MTPPGVESSTYIDSSIEINDKYPKFKIGCIVKITKYKNIFVKGYVPNWSEEGFLLKELGSFISDLNWGEIIGTFYDKELKITNQKELRVEKVKQRKGYRL